MLNTLYMLIGFITLVVAHNLARLALILSMLVLQAGDVERNPGPATRKLRRPCCMMDYLFLVKTKYTLWKRISSCTVNVD